MSSYIEFTGLTTLTFNGCEYEILLPIDTKRETLDIAHRADNKTWNTGKKIDVTLSENVIIQIRLGLRLSRTNMVSFESFMENNYNQEITIQAPGYDLFDDGNRGGVNSCRILGYAGSPVREDTNYYRVDLNLVKV